MNCFISLIRLRKEIYHFLFADHFAAFRALLDNYEMESGIAETYTFEEKQETVEFIDAIMDTDVMKETHKFLVSKGKAPEKVGDFKWKLLNLWFKLVRRTKGDR